MGTIDHVSVGVIVGAHGIKGEVKLKSFTSNPASIASFGPLQDNAGRVFEIAKLKPAGGDFIASLKGVTTRNQSEQLRGVELFVTRERLAPLKEGEAYAHDLMGSDVLLADGSLLGKLIAMPNYGAGDLLEVELAGNTETVLIPFTSHFVPQTDFTNGKITVVLPDGYLDAGEQP